MSDQQPMNRRRFFRHGLSELLKPLSRTIEPIEKMAREFGKMGSMINAPLKPPGPGTQASGNTTASGATTPPQASASLHVLRPPGAIDEEMFVYTCGRCGDCASVCPAHAIKLDKTGKIGGGAPYIDPKEMACVVCTDLSCMKVCTSGALLNIPIADINMGFAKVDHAKCTRSQGSDCRVCIDRCPLGTMAIDLLDGKVDVKEACLGCGVCEHDCPTDPEKKHRGDSCFDVAELSIPPVNLATPIAAKR